MSKTEAKILDSVKSANDFGALAGVEESRFLTRLEKAGKVVYVEWTPRRGAGWAIPGHRITNQGETS